MSWQIEKIGGLLTKVKRAGKLKASEYQQIGIFPVIDQGNNDIAGYSDNSEIVHRYPLPIVVFGDHTRRVKLVREPFICGADGTQLLYPHSEHIDPVFFYYAVKNIDLSNYFYARHFKFLKDQEIRFPNIPTQERIASTLSAYDDLIENNRRRITLLERLAQLLYREWFVHLRFPDHETTTFVDGLPEGWEIKSIDDLATTFRGKSYKSSELRENSKQPFINLKCFERGGGFRISGLKWFIGEHKEQHNVKSGEILIAVTDLTRDAAVVAQAARVPKTVGENAIYSMDIVKVIPKESIDSLWLYGLLRFSCFSVEVREKATGATVLHLKPKHIEKWATPIPPKSLRNLFSQRLQPVFEQIDNLEMQIQRLTKSRDLLLPRLMDGRIPVDL